jgi:hypothetical protein
VSSEVIKGHFNDKKLANSTLCKVALGGLMVSVLATGPKVRGFDPDQSTTSLGMNKNVA